MVDEVWVVMVNDTIDSVWTTQSSADVRYEKLHDPNPGQSYFPQFARCIHFFLNDKNRRKGADMKRQILMMLTDDTKTFEAHGEAFVLIEVPPDHNHNDEVIEGFFVDIVKEVQRMASLPTETEGNR